MVAKGQKVVGYVRVSTEEQSDSGLGLEAQKAAIRSACETRGWELVEVVEDSGVTGGTLDRPGLRRALEQIAAGEADGLVASKLDRLARSSIGFGRLIEWFEDSDAALVALDLGVDTSTPSGRMMAGVFATFAQYEREAIAERTRHALEAKRGRGEAISRPSVLDRPELVEQIEKLRDQGKGEYAIATALNREGVPTVRGGKEWRPSSVRTALMRLEGKSPRRKRRGSYELPEPKARG
jgi:DNA invertase Pin-like site-specific DNA recombinase